MGEIHENYVWFFLRKLLFGPWQWEKTFVIMTAPSFLPIKH